MCREWVTKNLNPLINITSPTKVTLAYLKIILGVIFSIPDRVWMEDRRVVFPFNMSRLGPNISSAAITSALRMGKFGRSLLRTMVRK